MNILKTTLRNAIKNKGITSLNILGLTAGFVCSVFLISWVIHESTYDSFVTDKDKIYRVILKGVINEEPLKSAGCMPGIATEAVKQIPGVEQSIRTQFSISKSADLIKTEDNNFFRAKGMAVDVDFFEFFPYKAIAGNLQNVLDDKNNIVIDKKLAEKCFGKELAIGKNLFLREKNYTVAAVLENIPTNSHLQFQYIIPIMSLHQSWHNNQWGSDNTLVYLKLNSNKNIETINSKVTSILIDHLPQFANFDMGLVLQPLKDIPFSVGFKWDNAKKTSKRNIYILSIVAFLILSIACINFTNLFISSAIKRKKEVGIKISNGANKLSIAKEYLGEVLTYVLFSFILSMILIKLLHPYFNQLSGANVEINYLSTHFFVLSIPLILSTTFMAGIFPGIYLTGINVSEVLKGGKTGSSKSNVQKILVTSQFVIATVLIFTMLSINKQINFLHSKTLGFDKENILYVHTEGKLKNREQQKLLKNELSGSPYIKSIAYRGSVPSKWCSGSIIGTNPDEYNVNMEWIPIDENYLSLSNIEFVEGENVFAYAHDSLKYCIINERAVEVLNLSPPYLGKILYSGNGNQKYIIKGITKNVNTKTLAQLVDPCIYTKPLWSSTTGIIMFKLARDRAKGIHTIRSYYEAELPDLPFEYYFLDDTYNALYKSEEKAKSIMSWFTAIALILTSLGLLAMVHFITENRTKEIGIRKVNGAKVSEILSMLNKDFIKWVAIAFVIACPIAYYAMSKWLENFAYKTTLSWWIFALAGVLALGIALVTVSWQSWRAATRNPVEALRYE